MHTANAKMQQLQMGFSMVNYGRTTHYQSAINNQHVGGNYFQPRLEHIPTKVWNVIFSLLQGWHHKVMTYVLI